MAKKIIFVLKNWNIECGLWICKINLPVVEIGEEHDSAKEEGHEHEEAVDHVEHAVLHEHELEHKHGHNEDDGGYDLD